MASSSSCLQFLQWMGKLKHLKRTGWVLKDIKEPETVSGHMYRMAMMAFLFDETDGIDVNKVMQMALVHDMAESKVGDLTPHCNVSTEEKHRRESEAMESFAKMLGEKSGRPMCDLFHEYEAQLTPESRLVMDLDKFDMILQAFEYETSQDRVGSLQDFFTSTEARVFFHPKVQQWVEELKQQRSLASLLKIANVN